MSERIITEETREKLSNANRGKSSPMKGVKLSEEIKNKISISHMGIKPSKETKKKMSESRKGKILSIVGRQKLSNCRKGVGNPAYIHGESIRKYCYQFYGKGGVRNRSLAFFNYKCIECGKTNEQNKKENGYNLSVHHVYYRKMSCCENELEYESGVRKVDNKLWIKETNGDIHEHEIVGKPEKFAVLCSSCHAKTTSINRYKWIKYYENLINNKYDGKSFLTKEEYDLFLSKPSH